MPSMRGTSSLSGCSRIAMLVITAAIVSLAEPRVETALSQAGTFPGRNGEIAVVRDHIVRYPSGDIHFGNGTGIFVVRPDGSHGHWFTSGRGHDPSWSPDGKT